MEFIVAGVAAVCAGCITNPLDVVKIRMQLQGELKYKGEHPVYYKNFAHAGYVIARNDGLWALQNGLSAALYLQFFMNGIRLGGSAAVCAGFFTNPLEVLKTRMQLQGELRAKGQHAVHYRNVVHAGYTVAKNDGILALQKGLSPALWVQLVMNGLRLGTFQFAESRGYMQDKNGQKVFYKQVLFGGIGGVLGQFLASPLFLIKTHLQSKAVAAIAVGHQHEHTGLFGALSNIYRKNGVKGLFRGAGASIPRAFVGSTSQLLSFDYAKAYLDNYEYFSGRPLLKSFLGSMVGGVAISVMMTPFDLILTRLYNQPIGENGKGKLYISYMDCVSKIYRSEGISAFYKGVGPMYLRLGPHTVLCLVFWDILKDFHEKYTVNVNSDIIEKTIN